MRRTHTNGDLNKKDLNKDVILNGWVQTRRDHGGIIFVDLRDKYGLTQIVMDPKDVPEADKLRREFVIDVEGKVRARPDEMVNAKLKTGEIEVLISKLKILHHAETPPIEIDDRKIAGDDARLKYRFLDLRRPQMQHHLNVRHKAMLATYKYMDSHKFTFIETPLFVKPTPEGARDYVVPSRVNPGKFYALPQSPQIYKQILMASGCDRYFQFARCLRDEDLRSDRQPEHTQIDIEMSFVQPKDVHDIVEGLIKAIFKETINVDIETPFERIDYYESMEKYGIDKPDLRYGLELVDVSHAVDKSDFNVFNSAIQKGWKVKCINAKGTSEIYSRKYIEGELTEQMKQYGAKGLAWMRMENDKLDSSIVKFFSAEHQKKIISVMDAKDGDVLFFSADKPKIVAEVLSHLRMEIAKKLNLINKDVYKFCWVTHFPLFEWNDEKNGWDPAHHMFCQPLPEWVDKVEKDPEHVRCTQYDLVLNGVELGSGSIRINDPNVQKAVMRVVGLNEEEANYKFGFMLEAFRYGTPPHGGIGLGFDRIVALLLGFNDIREVIAFPKNKQAQCPMDGSPSIIDDKAMKELHIKLDVKGEK